MVLLLLASGATAPRFRLKGPFPKFAICKWDFCYATFVQHCLRTFLPDILAAFWLPLARIHQCEKKNKYAVLSTVND